MLAEVSTALRLATAGDVATEAKVMLAAAATAQATIETAQATIETAQATAENKAGRAAKLAAKALAYAEGKVAMANEAETKVARMQVELARMSARMEEEQEHRLCVICMDQPKSVIALPCGHAVACQSCLKTQLLGQLEQPGGLLCLMCRARVASLHVVFME